MCLPSLHKKVHPVLVTTTIIIIITIIINIEICHKPGDVIDHERSSSTTVVTASDGAETFLAGRVPDLQFDLLSSNLNYSDTATTTFMLW